MTQGEALASVMAATCVVMAIVARGDLRRLALSMLAGLVAIRLAVWYAPSDWRYLASAAIWVSVGCAAIQRGTVTSGALLIVSGLCYAGAEILAAPAIFGNPALVLADVLWWGALLWGARRELVRDPDHSRMGRDDHRRGYLACNCRGDQAAQARKTMRPK